ncbi:MAG: M16 family metallopeptidase [Polymorphobacter sp.]|uniref:M16 family metallopeptidase n=1 Tax=Polymorphobacter sp. TaxID=1909290 RepID=UPI003A85113B
MRFLARLVLAAALLVSPLLPAQGQPAQSQSAPIADLVRAVDIPYEAFTLENGLRVIIHTDRKAPIVAVSIWYHIGSKDEPEGKTGFAHLFEHLMFYGSENNREPWFKTLDALGATQLNGTTWFDRTNYFQNVPTPALERTLYLESDRMGHLLGAVTQATLDAQRGVVQNEKRQGDNAPLGLTQYATLNALFPEGHPYAHSTIGSMADLDAASLDDVRGWFRANYGPNNAVLVLAGDIDAATARPMVERYFGDIPPGPAVKRFPAPVPVWTETRRETLTDKIPTPRLTRYWTLPGQLDPQSTYVDIALTVLAGGASSRLYNELVREKKLAVGVGGGVAAFEKVGWGSIGVTLAPGADPAEVESRVDAALAEFLENGPTDDELARIAMRAVSGTIRGLEAVGGFGGKAVTLAQGALYANDPEFYKKDLAAYASATPERVRAAARQWLARGDYRQTVMPGERPEAETSASNPAGAAKPATPIKISKRPPPPPVDGLPVLAAPSLERARLANGVEVTLARRAAVPVVRMVASFDGGSAADDPQMPGIAGLALGLLDEGAGGLTGPEIAEMKERLGLSISASRGIDRTTLSLDALAPNLAPSLDLFATIVQRPDFPPAELDRVRGQALTGIAQELSDPGSIARRLLPALLYGETHPYGLPSSGTPEGLNAVTRDTLQDWHRRWIRPDTMRLFVVGDIDMASLKPLLEKRLGSWQPPAAPKGNAALPPVSPATSARIILIDRPGSPQSYIRGGVILPRTGKDDDIALDVANDVLGGMSTSRLNTNIREIKNWAYGVRSYVSADAGPSAFQIIAPVQADRTADALAEIIKDAKALSEGKRPLTADERAAAIDGTIRSLPGSFESGSALLGSLAKNEALGRPDDYHANLTPRLSNLSLTEINKAAALLSPSAFTWVVVGDAETVRPQLEKLGLSFEMGEAR